MPEVVSLSVSSALHIVKDALKGRPLRIKGEVSGFKPHTTYRAFYFQLKDEQSCMEVTLWRNVYEKIGVQLKDGMIIEIDGSFDVYTARGSMSFVPHTLRVAGEGDLRAQIAALANKLQAEGLMDESRKKRLPRLPARIAVITSPNGAAVHDVLRTLSRRYPLAEVLFFGTPVEGAGADQSLTHALQAADGHAPDVILLVRGGGSFEDLLPFSAEPLVRAIAAAVCPVVTGIGHEPDYSIADMVADFRASTPTAAAEAVVPARDELLLELDGYRDRMALPFDQYLLRIDTLQKRLEQAIPGRLERDGVALENLRVRFKGAGERLLDRPRNRISQAAAQLDALSPLKVLGRGYAAAFDAKTHAVIDSIHKVSVGDEIIVEVADGAIRSTVESVCEKEEALIIEADTGSDSSG
jgi:exodeoxyribonuclease VII large subunit